MIIKLTQTEIHKFVALALHLNPVAFTLEISECAPQQAIDILQALRNATVAFPLYHSSQKISCIKMFRDRCPRAADGYSVVGLADAKWAVENVLDAIRNLERTGYLRPI